MESQPTVQPTKEGLILFDGQRVFARLFAATNEILLFSSSTDIAPLQVVSCGSATASRVQAENSVDTTAWHNVLNDVAVFQDDRAALVLEPMPAHVRDSLFPSAKSPSSQPVVAEGAGNVRFHIRTLTGKSDTYSLSRSLTIGALKSHVADGVSLNLVNLIFGATILKDDVLLETIPEDSVLFLVVKSGVSRPVVPAASSAPALAAPLVDEQLADKLLALAAQMLNLADFDGAFRAAEKAQQVVEGSNSKLRQVRCLNLLALVQKKRALYVEALSLYERGLVLAEQTDDNVGLLGELYLNVGDVKRKLEQYSEASNYYDKSEKMLEKVGDKKGLVGVLIGKGLVEKKASRYDNAKNLYKRAMDMEKKGTAKYAEIVYNLGDVLRKQEKMAEAKQLYLEALQVKKRKKS